MSQLFDMRLSKYWNLSFSISPSNEHPGLISFIYLFIYLFLPPPLQLLMLEHETHLLHLFAFSPPNHQFQPISVLADVKADLL